MGTFRDDEYYEKIVGCKEEAIQEKINEADKIKTASKRASDIRIFETGLFWNRGTYYWAFILAAYTAHFSLLSLLLNAKSTDEISQQEFFTLESFLSFSNFGLFCLTTTAFICFLFCLSWVLMNKGSRFWQKNWEEHVYKLEKAENIRLFATYLNPEFKDYKKCLFSFSPYDFSVSKIAFATSVLLLIISLVIFGFYIIILLVKSRIFELIRYCSEPSAIIAFLFLILFSCAIIIAFVFIPGNKHEDADKNDEWYQSE